MDDVFLAAALVVVVFVVVFVVALVAVALAAVALVAVALVVVFLAVAFLAAVFLVVVALAAVALVGFGVAAALVTLSLPAGLGGDACAFWVPALAVPDWADVRAGEAASGEAPRPLLPGGADAPSAPDSAVASWFAEPLVTRGFLGERGDVGTLVATMSGPSCWWARGAQGRSAGGDARGGRGGAVSGIQPTPTTAGDG
ncbi:hypothetical protein [Haliangium sp.]|uniref:hypothetical protein n=1 Tax=Haliangium sp. TaxID=2663208 RepID=UPI003D119F4C